MNLDTVKPYAKAFAGFVVPFAGQVLAAMQDGSQGGSTITSQEWLTAALTSVVAAGSVFAVPNKDPQGVKQDESVQPPDAGLGHRQEVAQTYTVNPATPAGEPVVVESAGPDYPITDFVGGTTPPTTTEPDKSGYWGGV